jgi:anaerobic selenocysteine-containing dehydrogenase
MERRDFLKSSALATVGTMLIPSFLKAQQYSLQNGNSLSQRYLLQAEAYLIRQEGAGLVHK